MFYLSLFLIGCGICVLTHSFNLHENMANGDSVFSSSQPWINFSVISDFSLFNVQS